jgi:molybdenum cofactor biosynthesis enzyme MoaA
MKKYITSDKLKHHPERVYEWLQTGWSKPITAQFQITNVCPYRCVYCDKVLNDEHSHVSDLFINRLKELGIKSVILTGGEPVVYDKFEIDVPKLEESFELGIVTTLVKYQPLLETHFQWVKVSIDSVDEKIFKEIRQGGRLKNVLVNLEKLYSQKKETTKIGTQIVLTHENKTEKNLNEFIKRLYDICDYIQIRPIESLQPYHYTESDYDLIKSLEAKHKKIIISDKFNYNFKPKNCPSRWSQIFINSKHEIMLCCNRSTEKIVSIYDIDAENKIKNYQLDTRRCFRSCVLSGNNHYLDSLKNESHKNFV